jgi:hypothetical protein
MHDRYYIFSMRFSQAVQAVAGYFAGAGCADLSRLFEPFALQFIKQDGRNPVAAVPFMIPNRPAALRRIKFTKDFGSPHV